ncbi:M23 family metallopeptidase [Agromyces atrinae]|uniref:M23 family metallopeptidase n=1 Tax=Agromyces atrinae TaxID=592376 RepID=UPI001F5922DC|nr:M23 family metallopeptidase [Agromyces atrinae]MCI2959556.1 M23 family metallopeptidase [Agromyces atrinae]
MTALWPTGSTTQPRITDGYGPRPPIRGSRPFHYGVDVSLDLDAAIPAALAGRVVFAGSNGTLGRQVVVDSGDIQFLYSHMREDLAVSVGDEVKRGQTVGYVGLTGNTTGPHTCFRTFAGDWRNDSDARDPVDIMAALNVTTAGGGTLIPTDIEGAFDVNTIWIIHAPGKDTYYWYDALRDAKRQILSPQWSQLREWQNAKANPLPLDIRPLAQDRINGLNNF